MFHLIFIYFIFSCSFLQDIVVPSNRNIVFAMKFEAPTDLFKENEETFKSIKTSGYYAIDKEEGGMIFMEL